MFHRYLLINPVGGVVKGWKNRGVIQDLKVHKAGSDVKTVSSVEKWKKFDIKIEKKRILQCKCIERRIREL